MNRLLIIARCCVSVAVLLMAEPYVHAASIDATARKGYGRINFTFGAPAKLQTASNGTTAVLKFDTPVTQSADSIKTALPDYVEAANLSADKRTVTLTLRKPMRLRQFVSGNAVGVDLIDSAPLPKEARNLPEDISGDASPEPLLSTKPAAPKVVVNAKADAKEKEKAKKPSEVVAVAKAKKTAEPKKVEAPLVVARTATKIETSEPAPKAEDPMLSTKPAVVEPEPVVETPPPAAPEPAAVLTTKPEKPAVDEDTLASEPPAAKLAVEAKQPEPVKPEPVVPAPAPVPEPVAEKPTVPAGPFTVTARTVDNETTLNFPWSERTAAAVFENARDIWIVFSKARDVNAGLLRTVLPKQVIGVTQYAYKGNTVLRLTTDGTIHANAAQPAKGYQWNVVLSSSQEKPAQDVSVSVDSLEGSLRVILGIFDVAPTLRFYDPNSGEQLVVVPSFDSGHAVRVTRNFPEFSVLASNQGVALISRRPDLTIGQTRTGLVLGSKEGLEVSESLPLITGTAPAGGTSATSGVMIPYDQWFVPIAEFRDMQLDRIAALAGATKATKADSMMELVKLYLSQGMGVEAAGMLNLIHQEFPEYYTAKGLAMLSAAANVLVGHMDTAASDLMAPELNDREEAQLWRQVVALYAKPATNLTAAEPAQAASSTSDAVNNDPAAVAAAATAAAATPAAAVQKPTFQYLKFNKPFIRFYPPAIRQRLAVIAADAYLADGQEEKAIAVYDVLSRDGILGPVTADAEYTLARAAEKKAETGQALDILDRLAKQTKNRYIAVRASYSAAMLRYRKEQINPDAAADIVERDRVAWRGDALELEMLKSLVGIYKDIKRYDEVLRTQRAMLEAFPDQPDTITISGETAELFENIFLNDLGKDLPPLKALSLFYEFRELTPLGDKGDLIIQQLADRLAAIDLLDRATQLLENQIRFRSTGESRSKIGARLALLHLLNKHPQEALNVLEVTNYGENKPELQTLRRQLMAEALTKLGKHEEALGILYNDTTAVGAQLRLNVLWTMKDWTNIVNRAEDILTARPNLTEPLNATETETLLKLALAYTFEGDYTQLRYLRDYYSGLIPDTAYKQIFEFITNDTTPLDPEDFNMLAAQISRTESFLDMFKAKIAAGKLSETVQ